MALPTATEIRTFLEGYQVSTAVLTDAWIEQQRDNFIVPFLEGKVGISLDGGEATEYLSGTGKDILILSRKDIASLVSVEYVTLEDSAIPLGLAGFTLLPGEGFIKSVNSVFKKGEKNIKVVYNIGAQDLFQAVIYLCSDAALVFIGARTGGGSIQVEGFGRNFGERGKYQDIRNELARWSTAIIKKYTSGVVGR